MSDQQITLYSFPLSGNAHRVELALSLLGLPFTLKNVDLKSGDQRSPEFLALNPVAKVPVLVDGDVVLSESTAILTYLADKYDDGTWVPRDAAGRAEVHKWYAIAAGELQNGPANARLIHLFHAAYDPRQTMERALQFLERLDAALTGADFLVRNQPSFADVAIYTYVAHAPEGGVPLDDYEHVTAWLARVEALAGFKPMVRSPLPAAAA